MFKYASHVYCCLRAYYRKSLNQAQAPDFFEQGPRTSRLDAALKDCQSYQEFLHKFGLLENDNVPMDLAEGQKHKHKGDDDLMPEGKRQCMG